ncbi:TonB-dependent receptor [Sphingobacterium sp. UT-1RO-CII-1]|uniref:SusC/RagA family TonB-linked outer membrane protein n=1 Tax=Sphingobacterium sp. UT-1RO-CII-1 TaxID=2995225 RepID=UPI00227C3AA6|nr:TonB-dependent receptor [Sphingobacterium sp. UT-1RO-CII-1]MCY4779610.1 TonB-dependent receptor [Sphingobacterium sp. UT-1RO-CII-1]
MIKRKVHVSLPFLERARSRSRLHSLLKVMGISLFACVVGGNVKASPFSKQEKLGFYKDLEIQKSIGGIVKNSNGEPIVGATIRVERIQVSQTTNEKGVFNFSNSDLKNSDFLSISYVGYKSQKIAIGNTLSFDIVLEQDEATLDEVVVVGYGTQKRSHMTAAVDVVSGEALTNRPSANVSDLIKGASPNMNINMGMRGGEPGAASGWNIRGVGSLNGNSSPLVLVDGVEVDINSVDPETVESVSVLKDASAAAVYGSRAPYGVVLITTKKGKQSDNTQVSYSNNFSLNSLLRLPHFIDSYTWATVYNQANANAGLAPVYSDEQMERIKGYLDGTFPYEYDPDNPIDNIWAGRRNGNANNDWPHLLMGNNSISHKHNINVSGGSAKTQYFLSAGYTKQNGTYAFGHDHYRRYNLLSNLSTEVTDWLRINSSLKWAQSDTDYPMGETTVGREHTFREMLMFAPMMPHYNINGTVQSPLVRLLEDSGRDKSKRSDFLANIGAELEPVKGWKTVFNYNYNIRNTKASANPKPVMVELGDGSLGNIGKPESVYTSAYSEYVYKILNLVSSYEQQLDKHYFNVMAGYEQEEALTTGLSATGTSPVVDNYPSIKTSLGGVIATDNMADWSNRGVFGRLNYNYDEKYLVELSGRYSGSSRFPKEKRFGFFPSASVGYTVSKEDFWKPISPYLEYFKVRVSYGSLGNQNIANHLFYDKLGIVGEGPWIMGNKRPQYANVPALISDDITWETITTLNFGVETRLLNSRLDLSFDWYDRRTYDMLGAAYDLPFLLGTGTPVTNNADLSTKGFELVLGWNDKIGSEFNYNVKLALGDSRTTITRYLNLTERFDTWYAGKKYGEIWGFETEGIIQTAEQAKNMADQSRYHKDWRPGDIQYKDLSGDGTIDEGSRTLSERGDLKVIGNKSPRYNVGINLGASWKGIDFNMFWQGILKREFYPEASSPLFWGTTGAWASSGLYRHSPALDYWRPADETNILGPNTDAYLPKPYFTPETNKNRQVQDRYLQNAGYIRLKNLQIGYTIPQSVTKNIFSKARVYFSGENLLTFSGLDKVFDPETAMASDSREGGYLTNGVIYPMSKVFSFGVNITLN